MRFKMLVFNLMFALSALAVESAIEIVDTDPQNPRNGLIRTTPMKIYEYTLQGEFVSIQPQCRYSKVTGDKIYELVVVYNGRKYANVEALVLLIDTTERVNITPAHGIEKSRRKSASMFERFSCVTTLSELRRIGTAKDIEISIVAKKHFTGLRITPRYQQTILDFCQQADAFAPLLLSEPEITQLEKEAELAPTQHAVAMSTLGPETEYIMHKQMSRTYLVAAIPTFLTGLTAIRLATIYGKGEREAEDLGVDTNKYSGSFWLIGAASLVASGVLTILHFDEESKANQGNVLSIGPTAMNSIGVNVTLRL